MAWNKANMTTDAFYSYALAKWPNKQDAEDFSQYAMTKCLNKDFQNVQIRTLYIDFLRNKYHDNRVKNKPVFVDFDQLKTPIKYFQDYGRILQLNDILSVLNEKDRACILLYYFYGFNQLEIAFLFGLANDTMHVHMTRIRKKLKKKLSKDNL